MENLVKTQPSTKRSGGFLSGVLVLSMSTVLVKILGLVYRIPMLKLLGTEGMGYFNTAFELYALVGVTATAGLPVALSVRISGSMAGGRYSEVKKTWRTALCVFLVCGVIGMLFLGCCSVPLARFLKSESAASSIFAIAPALFFTCTAGALRGYFQGFGNMTPTAVSQLIEAAGKLVFGLLFANLALSRGYSVAGVAAFAVIGLGVGTAVSLLYLLAEKKRFDTSVREFSLPDAAVPSGNRHMLRSLLAIALPVTLSSSVMGVTRILDMTMILRRLQTIGFGSVEANELYGAYTTLALPVFHLVPSLITSVALPLLPSVAASREAGEREEECRVISSALRITALLAMPASLALTAFSAPVLGLLFRGESEAITVSAPLLSLLGGSVFFSCLMTVAGSVLQAYRKVMIPIWAMLAGIAVKTVSSYLMIGSPSLGIYGAPISTFLCGLTVTSTELYHVIKNAPEGLSLRELFFRPFLSAVGAVGIAFVIFRLLPDLFRSSVGILLLFCGCAVLYTIFAFFFGAFSADRVSALLRRKKTIS